MSTTNLDHLFSPVFPADEFRRRRQTIAAEIGPAAYALLQGAPRKEQPHPKFSQSKIFFYLSGVELERCYLLIHGQTAESVLFIPDDQIEGVPGGVLDAQDMKTISTRAQIEEVRPLSRLPEHLERAKTLYTPHQPDETAMSTSFAILNSSRFRAQDPLEKFSRRDEALIQNLKAQYPRIEIADLTPVIQRMRRIKSRAEIAVLRKTGDMAARMCIEGMKATRPGLPAAGLQAIGEYVYRFLGNCGLGYDFEVSPSHPQSAVLLDGDMVLVDGGPDYHHYTTDIARIWPVNGHFDSWQRHTYGLIADYMETLLRLTAPGKLIRDIYAEAASSMLKAYEGDQAGTAIIQNMMHRDVSYINHHVGLSVHDAVGSWREEPLQAGMVVVIDPMVWLDHAPHSYVRVEDTVVITEQGCERLTGLAPILPEAIEDMMQQPSNFPLSLHS